jgi:hypothetical protein
MVSLVKEVEPELVGPEDAAKIVGGEVLTRQRTKDAPINGSQDTVWLMTVQPAAELQPGSHLKALSTAPNRTQQIRQILARQQATQ